MPSVFAQAAYARLLELGEIDRHLRRTRRLYHARRNALIDALAQSLPEATVGGAAAGLHLIAWLPEGTDESAVSDAAAERGVAILTLHRDCAVAAAFAPALLLGYGMVDESVIPRAVEELAQAVRQ
jgi:GntR family transcriptional regulator/MocR family aminotransferase